MIRYWYVTYCAYTQDNKSVYGNSIYESTNCPEFMIGTFTNYERVSENFKELVVLNWKLIDKSQVDDLNATPWFKVGK